MMTGPLDQLQPGVRQRLLEPPGGINRDQRVPRVGEQQDRRGDRREHRHQLVQLAHQGTLLSEEGPPQRAVLALGVSPDVPVDVLVRGQRAAARSRTILASLARANQGVSRHATSAQTGPAIGAASSRSQPFRQPGPMLASRISASTRSGARLAADSATPPP